MNARTIAGGVIGAGLAAAGVVAAVGDFRHAHDDAELQHSPDATDFAQQSAKSDADGELLIGMANLALGGILLVKGKSPAIRMLAAGDTAFGALATGSTIGGWMSGSTAKEIWERNS